MTVTMTKRTRMTRKIAQTTRTLTQSSHADSAAHAAKLKKANWMMTAI